MDDMMVMPLATLRNLRNPYDTTTIEGFAWQLMKSNIVNYHMYEEERDKAEAKAKRASQILILLRDMDKRL